MILRRLCDTCELQDGAMIGLSLQQANAGVARHGHARSLPQQLRHARSPSLQPSSSSSRPAARRCAVQPRATASDDASEDQVGFAKSLAVLGLGVSCEGLETRGVECGRPRLLPRSLPHLPTPAPHWPQAALLSERLNGMGVVQQLELHDDMMHPILLASVAGLVVAAVWPGEDAPPGAPLLSILRRAAGRLSFIGLAGTLAAEMWTGKVGRAPPPELGRRAGCTRLAAPGTRG